MAPAQRVGAADSLPARRKAGRLEGVAAGSAAQIGGRAAGMVFGFAATVIVSRYLGVSDYGRMSAALAFWAVFSLSSEMGVTAVVAGEIAKPEADVVTVWASGIAVQAFYSVIALVAGLGASSLVFANDRGMMVGIAVGAPLMFASMPAVNSIHQVRLRMWVPAVLGIAQSAAVLALSVVAVISHAAWQAFVGVSVLAGVLSVGVNLGIGVREAGRRPGAILPLARVLAKLSIVVGLATLLETAYFKLDSVLVYRMAGAEQGGLYGAAYRVYELILTVPTAVMSSAIPVAVRHMHADPEELRRYNRMVTWFLLLAGLSAAVAVTLLSHFIVGIIFGSQFVEAALLLSILTAAAVTRFISIWQGSIVIAAGDRTRYLGVTAVAAAFALGLDLTLIPRFHALAAACVTSGTELLVMTLMFFALGKAKSPSNALRLLPVALAGVGAWVLALVVSQGDVPTWTQIVGAGLSSAFVVFAFVALVQLYRTRSGAVDVVR